MSIRVQIRAAVVFTWLSLACSAQAGPATERTYPFPAANVQAALQKMGAYQGGRLPSLDGFIKPVRTSLAHYERTYYEYKIELEPHGDNQAVVRVRAHVSAWYADPRGVNSGYQDFESNGRLENDLLDRLDDFLTRNGASAGADPESLQKEIDEVRRQRQQVENHISALEKQLEDSRQPRPPAGDPEYASITRPRAAIVSAPQIRAAVLLHAQQEDVFEILERRGAWVRVRLEDDRSGWIKAADAHLFAWPNGGQDTPNSTLAGGFTIVRELTSSFSGDWPRLKGKQAVYIWARPEGSNLNVQPDKKLPFAESIFMQRARQEIHRSGESVQGIVVIFLDLQGGVAAATMEDIQAFAEGSLTAPAFLKKCSLDPPSAFLLVRAQTR